MVTVDVVVDVVVVVVARITRSTTGGVIHDGLIVECGWEMGMGDFVAVLMVGLGKPKRG